MINMYVHDCGKVRRYKTTMHANRRIDMCATCCMYTFISFGLSTQMSKLYDAVSFPYLSHTSLSTE